MNAFHPYSLNINVRGLGLSATLAINERCKALRREGRDIYNFGLGQSPFPVPAPVVEELKRNAHQKDYLPPHGLPALREAVAEFHRRLAHCDADPQHVLVGPGSKELMFLLQLVFYGEILVTTPCWVSYLPQAMIIGRRVSRLHTRFADDWKITPAQLLDAIERVRDDSRPRILVLNYPDNPTGVSYTAAELRALAEVARRYRVVVLSDEIYGHLHHRGEHRSIAECYPEGTIISSGLSKWCGAGGWRLGTFVFPPDLRWLLDAMAAAASETFTSVCAPVQYAAVEAFRCGPQIETYLAHARRILRLLAGRAAATLRAAGIRVTEPDGAFYLYLDFTALKDSLAARGVTDSAALCERLLEGAGAALLPGAAFVRSRGELAARLAYVDFDGAAAMEASASTPIADRLPDGFADEYCERVVRGCERIAQWASAEA